MAARRFLYINGTTGLPTESAQTDDLTLASFSINGGGPTINSTGMDMNSTTISDVGLLSFSDPATDGILQTAGTLAADNIMAKERDNVMSTTGAILFGTITDTAGLVDSLKLPNLAGTPTAVPAFSTVGGYEVYDSTNKILYIWDGSAWRSDYATAASTPKVINIATYTADATTITANDVVYISGEGLVSPADSSAEATARAIGFATAGAEPGSPVSVQMAGVVSGFTGLTAGNRLFLSETPGQVVSTVNSSAPSEVIQVGYAANSTTVQILLQHLGVRTA